VRLRATEAYVVQMLVMMHAREIVVRDLRRSNVVRATTGSALQWSLLEFTSVTRPSAKAFSVTARTCPPEVCALCPFPRAHLAARLQFTMRQLAVNG
jgi:hypothetical protein